MERPDDFDRGDCDQNRQETYEEGKWYRVSYQNDNGVPPIVMPMGEQSFHAPRSKWSRVFLVAVCTVLALSLLTMAAFGGMMISNYMAELEKDNPTINPAVSGQTGSLTGNVYGESGGSTYNYAAVIAQLTKNDGSALVGSTNGSAGNDGKSLIAVVAEVKDSVVEIMTTVETNRGTVQAGAGSGVIIHADGIIVTNNHVVEGYEDSIYVRLTNGNTYKAYLRGVDEEGDIAIIKITPQETLTVAKFGNSAALAVGEDVFAIGNPLGSLGGTMTDGTISALEREVVIGGVTMTLLQTNAAINSGNSGGGLFNMAGELIGVVNAKYSASGVEGLGFAIPIDTAYTSICLLLEKGYIPGVPTMGVTVEVKTVSAGFMSYYNVLYVYEENADTVFEKGDYIYYVAGISVSDVDAVKQIVRQYEVGDTIDVIVVRGGQQMTLSVKLIENIPS